ncbi:MAG: 4Fe-4S dicluster domain-containing protein [Chloroflexi bacterium]|nr:4Fe-4S dicluster domain-containing protein [Chloroflexota bacterium]
MSTTVNIIAEKQVTTFADTVALAQNVDINNCLQCRKCAAGCPMVEKMDLNTVQLLHAVRLGLKDVVLESNTYWLCVGCGACVTRCPFKIDTPAIMDKLSQIARAEGRKPKEKDIALFWDIAGKNITSFGKMYELGIMLPLKLRTLNLFTDIPMGLKLISQGKMEILPPSQNKAEIRRIAKKVKTKEGQE